MNIKVTDKISILIIEDDEFDCEQVKRSLKKTDLSYEVTTASNVNQGIECVKHNNYDIIFLDYHLPGKSGIELLKHFNQLINFRKVAVIIISLTEDEDIVFECLKLGAKDFISKENLSPVALKRAILNAQIKITLEADLKQSNRQLKHLAENDSLTGLSNRYYFNKHLNKHLNKADPDKEFSLVLLDIDNFKNVNDVYGHATGDELLKAFADILKSTLPQNVLFARIGGDEFAILLDTKAVDPQWACEAISKALESYVCIGEAYQRISVSIGYATWPRDTRTKSKLYQFADLALYYSKNNKNNSHVAFSTSLHQATKERIQLKEVIRQAFKNNQFSIHFQPIINSSDDSLKGFEALMRLEDNSVSIPANKFIQVLEQMKLIHELGFWLIEEVLKQQSKWIKLLGSDIVMSINLSPVQLNNEHIIDYIFDKIKQHQINPKLVMFELTETVLLENASKIKNTLKRISAFGCQIALDDFGTGFSSLSHLKEFPISTVKIDKSMIPRHKDDIKTINIIQGLVMMLNSLELNIVAEGIETDGQLKFCKGLNISNLQGYIYDKPLAMRAVENKYFKTLDST